MIGIAIAIPPTVNGHPHGAAPPPPDPPTTLVDDLGGGAVIVDDKGAGDPVLGDL